MKFSLFYLFYRVDWPPRMNTSPGTMNEYPKQVSPDGTNSSPITWYMIEVNTI